MLSKSEILQEMDKGNIVINDFDLSRLQPNSYDCLLGDVFFEVIWDRHGPMFIGPQVYLSGSEVSIPVGGTLLGHTADYVETNNNIVGVLWSPSSVARVGMGVCFNAGLGDRGFRGKWVLEMSSSVRVGQPKLKVGGRVAQIVFFRSGEEDDITYNGQYQKGNCDWPYCLIPKAYRDINHRVVKNHSVLAAMNSEYQ